MNDESGQSENTRPMIEWIFGAVSAVVVAGLLAFLAYEAAFGNDRPPDLTARIDKVESVANGTLVVVAVSNAGDAAAAQVGVEAVVPGEPAVSKEIVFDYLPAHARRRGAFVLEGVDVAPADLRITIHGYVEP